MQTVAETPTFTKQAEALFDEEGKQELITFLSLNPLAGEGDCWNGWCAQTSLCSFWQRQARGARVIYYYLDEAMLLYALLVYPKNAKTDLTQVEKRAVTAFVMVLKAARRTL